MLIYKIKSRLRAIYYMLTRRLSIRMLGANARIFGARYISMQSCSIGDNCWIQAVSSYKEQRFNPAIVLGERVMMSSNVHISAVSNITIGSHTLLGSNIYIGDHSHGSTSQDKFDPATPPALRPLDDIADIYIGENVWICDNVVVLAGSHIASSCVVAANSVVKGYFDENCLIAGSPAKIIRKLK